MAFLFAEVDVMNDFLLHHVRGHYLGSLAYGRELAL